MKYLAAAVASGPMVVMAAWIATASTSADGVDRIGPPEGTATAWTADRMRDARDRLKDILPGGRDT